MIECLASVPKGTIKHQPSHILLVGTPSLSICADVKAYFEQSNGTPTFTCMLSTAGGILTTIHSLQTSRKSAAAVGVPSAPQLSPSISGTVSAFYFVPRQPNCLHQILSILLHLMISRVGCQVREPLRRGTGKGGGVGAASPRLTLSTSPTSLSRMSSQTSGTNLHVYDRSPSGKGSPHAMSPTGSSPRLASLWIAKEGETGLVRSPVQERLRESPLPPSDMFEEPQAKRFAQTQPLGMLSLSAKSDGEHGWDTVATPRDTLRDKKQLRTSTLAPTNFKTHATKSKHLPHPQSNTSSHQRRKPRTSSGFKGSLLNRQGPLRLSRTQTLPLSPPSMQLSGLRVTQRTAQHITPPPPLVRLPSDCMPTTSPKALARRVITSSQTWLPSACVRSTRVNRLSRRLSHSQPDSTPLPFAPHPHPSSDLRLERHGTMTPLHKKTLLVGSFTNVPTHGLIDFARFPVY
jgi:hypothetical protein